MAKMRYIHQAVEELKQADPQTPVTVYYVRKLVAAGTIPAIMNGRRRLINYDVLLEYLKNGNDNEPPQSGSGQ